MGQLPSNRPPKKKKPLRKHVPGLRADTLKVKLSELRALDVHERVKQDVADILNAAANPDHGKPSVIVKSLPKERQALIQKTAKAVKAISDDVMARGKQRLLEMSEQEWDALVNEQAD